MSRPTVRASRKHRNARQVRRAGRTARRRASDVSAVRRSSSLSRFRSLPSARAGPRLAPGPARMMEWTGTSSIWKAGLFGASWGCGLCVLGWAQSRSRPAYWMSTRAPFVGSFHAGIKMRAPTCGLIRPRPGIARRHLMTCAVVFLLVVVRVREHGTPCPRNLLATETQIFPNPHNRNRKAGFAGRQSLPRTQLTPARADRPPTRPPCLVSLLRVPRESLTRGTTGPFHGHPELRPRIDAMVIREMEVW